ncbi:TPA: hypothetical protein ACK8UT_000189 [Legionella pneumophila]
MKHIRLSKIEKMSLFKVILTVIFFFTEINAYAGIESYHIKYHKDSKIKNVSLSNIEILIEFHRNGNSIGRITTKTSNTQDIKIDNTYGKNLIIHILSMNIDGKRIRCWGVSTRKTNTIEIQCDKVVSLKKMEEETKPSDSIN